MHAVVIGDVQGHADALEAALAAAGVDVSGGTIPDEVMIVQVGDLVHRGPDSDAVISLVDRFIRLPNWVQLIGNHEGTYLDSEHPGIARQLSADSRDTLQLWWDAGLCQVATALRPRPGALPVPEDWGQVPDTDILVTHAGLTRGAWQILGRPESAIEAARLLNSTPAQVWREGEKSTGIRDEAAGPLWASAEELLDSWWFSKVPARFHQIHGHSTVRCWDPPGWYVTRSVWLTPEWFMYDDDSRIEVSRVGGRIIWGVDPGHGHNPAHNWSPLVLPLDDHPPGEMNRTFS